MPRILFRIEYHLEAGYLIVFRTYRGQKNDENTTIHASRMQSKYSRGDLCEIAPAFLPSKAEATRKVHDLRGIIFCLECPERW